MVLLLCVITGVYAQDDYPDYRSKKEMFTRILEKDIRADIASFAFGGLDESIGKLPLKTIPVSSVSANSISFMQDQVQVTVKSETFDATKHKLSYYDGKYLVRIDNKPYFGDYGKVPKTCISEVTVIIDRDTIQVPQTALSDLCNPVFSTSQNGVQQTNNKVYVSNDGRKVYVYLLKQERGGSYEVTWVIQDKKYLKRVVDFGFLK